MESRGGVWELNLPLSGNKKKGPQNQNPIPSSKIIIQCVMLYKLSNLPLPESIHLSNGNNTWHAFCSQVVAKAKLSNVCGSMLKKEKSHLSE